MPHRGINGGKMKNTADEKIICHICGKELKEFDFVGYWLGGGTGNVLRPVCKDKEECIKRQNEIIERERLDV